MLENCFPPPRSEISIDATVSHLHLVCKMPTKIEVFTLLFSAKMPVIAESTRSKC